jgi:hypothetical protein
MMDENSALMWWMRAIAYAAFASLGGALGHLMRTFDKATFSWARCILESLAAGFVGLLMLLACQALGLSEQWTGVIVGVSGWLGANATIRMLEALVRKKLGLDPSAETPNGGAGTP